MKNIAIYPGTFDPITFGHIDVIKKALKLVDRLIVGISDGNQKNFLFPIDERVKIVQKAIYNDLKFKKKYIKIITFESLTTDLCTNHKTQETSKRQRKLNNKIETIFLMSNLENQIISSRFVKEIAQHKGDLKKFTTKSTIKSLKNIYA